MEDNNDHHQLWEDVLKQLQMQMTEATFNEQLRGTYLVSISDDEMVIGVDNANAKDWLENRLRSTIDRTVTNLLKRSVEIQFVIQQNGQPVVEAEDQLKVDPADLPGESPGRHVARANYHKAFFQKGGSGYSMVAHHHTFFVAPLLGKAFLLWKLLESHDTRPLSKIGPNYWSPPIRGYSFADLAEKMNQSKSSCIIGEPRECLRSMERRLKEGDPITDLSDCCGGPHYEHLWLKPHPDTEELMCKHWSEGMLETLHAFGLVRLELSGPTGRKPIIQVWRMIPILTPTEYRLLNDTLKTDYLEWLFGSRYGGAPYAELFDIPDQEYWEQISEPHLVPLMPDYSNYQINDNFLKRKTYSDFMRNAVNNPNYLPCMGDNFQVNFFCRTQVPHVASHARGELPIRVDKIQTPDHRERKRIRLSRICRRKIEGL
jgi:hypothetical protein